MKHDQVSLRCAREHPGSTTVKADFKGLWPYCTSPTLASLTGWLDDIPGLFLLFFPPPLLCPEIQPVALTAKLQQIFKGRGGHSKSQGKENRTASSQGDSGSNVLYLSLSRMAKWSPALTEGRGWKRVEEGGASLGASGAGDVKRGKPDGKQITSNMAVSFSKQQTNTWSNKGEPEQLVTSSLQQEKKGDYVKCGLNFKKHYH